MDIDHYATRAVALLNDRLAAASVDGLRAHLADRPHLAGRVVEADLPRLRRLQAALGSIWDASAAGDADAVVEQLNQLLARHPISPRISGHDHHDWHLHVHDDTASVAAALTSEALFGLTMFVTDRGPTRLGRCAAEDCNWAFMDVSTNHSRRFCDTPCATRTNVAALRRRRREAGV